MRRILSFGRDLVLMIELLGTPSHLRSLTLNVYLYLHLNSLNWQRIILSDLHKTGGNLLFLPLVTLLFTFPGRCFFTLNRVQYPPPTYNTASVLVSFPSCHPSTAHYLSRPDCLSPTFMNRAHKTRP